MESDLLLSTFAAANLAHMTPSQLQQYDRFLDENDWDIYYWATQQPTPTSLETAEGGSNTTSSIIPPSSSNLDPIDKTPTEAWRQGAPRSGEWAQTVGTFKPAYRPVPARWKNSEILALLRRHVIDRIAGGVHLAAEEETVGVRGKGLAQGVKGIGGGGLGRMPEVQNFDQ